MVADAFDVVEDVDIEHLGFNIGLIAHAAHGFLAELFARGVDRVFKLLRSLDIGNGDLLAEAFDVEANELVDGSTEVTNRFLRAFRKDALFVVFALGESY